MATTIDQKNFVKTALRLPPELHGAVHEAAQKNGRSYNAELVERIQASFNSEPSAVYEAFKKQERLSSVLSHFVVELANLVPAKTPEVQTLLNLIQTVGVSVKDGQYESAAVAARALAAHWEFLESAKPQLAGKGEKPKAAARTQKPKP